jgi:von Willebrand factor type A domain
VRLAAAFLTIGFGLPATCGASAGLGQVRPKVEVAFVLDTTGSMGGLIDGAKRRIWSIARQIGEGRPRPDVRIALVAYRDRGDEYVTRVFGLTGDMDEVYRNLMSLQASGGGDAPEHVSAALSDAVHKVAWSQGPALRVMFLVGDAPPHVDYQDGFDYRRHVREARDRGIGVETIECGADPETARYWQEMAGLGGGHFARIDANGGMPVRVTPVDDELARLGAELGTTVVAGGSAAERAKTEGRLAARAAMPTPMAVDAAGYFASADRLAEKDLVDLPAQEQKKELLALRNTSGGTPATLAGKGDAEAVLYLQRQKDRRQEIQKRIAALQTQREVYLSRTAAARDGFDEQVLSALRARAKAVGIDY